MAKPRIKVMVGYTDGKHWWIRIVASNGKVILDSEVYDNKSNAMRAANRLAKVLGLKVDLENDK